MQKKAPSVLLVGLGSPKQEKWIYDNLRLVGAKVAIGVGGSFDVMAGNIKRAPRIFRKLGLEWLHRLLTQPTRWRRMLRLPKFVLTVLKAKGHWAALGANGKTFIWEIVYQGRTRRHLCFFGKERCFAKRILRNIDKTDFFFAEAEWESFGRMSFVMRQKQCVFGTETDTFCAVW